MSNYYRATVFLKFSVDNKGQKEMGFEGIPASGLLHDELFELLDGSEGLVKVESAVVKECAPLPTPITTSKGELLVIQTICQGCNQLKEVADTPRGRVCIDCNGSVYPLRRKELN